MGTYFLDTSAIIKRYILEQGQAWVLSLCDPVQGHVLYISQAARVETVAAICRRAREQSITLSERDRLIETFRRDSQKGYNTWPVTSDVYDAAGDLCRSHRLRAYDAVQLACALAVREYARANKAPEPIFACADLALLSVATAEGLSIENPSNHSQIESARQQNRESKGEEKPTATYDKAYDNTENF